MRSVFWFNWLEHSILLQHPDYKLDSPKSNASKDALALLTCRLPTEDLGITREKTRASKTMSSAKPLPDTTNEDQTLDFHRRNRGYVLEELPHIVQSTCVATPACQNCCCKLPNTRHKERTGATLSSTQLGPLLPTLASNQSSTDFLHVYQLYGNIY
jgi:hypothetical protein